MWKKLFMVQIYTSLRAQFIQILSFIFSSSILFLGTFWARRATKAANSRNIIPVSIGPAPQIEHVFNFSWAQNQIHRYSHIWANQIYTVIRSDI